MAKPTERRAPKPRIRTGPPGTILRASGKDGPQIIASSGARWTDESEARFLDHLASSCNVTLSAAAAGFSKEALYRRRRIDPDFAQAWQTALEQGYVRLEMLLIEGATASSKGADRAERKHLPFPDMTVREAIVILQLHRASVKGDGMTRGAGWRARPRRLDEVRDSILKKLEAIANHDPETP